ncbi:hypothetical protein [Haloarcula laminariae]|uniref:hypothetical protein n=1 Tax=Haloarcula laminariae TaxID=2961577 RepID=UPI0021C83974|nr:hypothetical protein [Halomicroarcula laminariae]
MTHIVERDDWQREEYNRVERALAEGRFWERVQPEDIGFWDAFDSILLANYPESRFEEEEPQTRLADFGGGASA